MNDFHSNAQKDQQQKSILRILSMNCAGWNPIKLYQNRRRK